MIEFNKSNLKDFAEELTTFLEAFAESNNVNVEIKGGRFSPNSFKPSIIFTSSQVSSEYEASFLRLYKRYNLKKDDLGKEFLYDNITFKLIGINSKAKKFPIVAEALSGNNKGKLYKLKSQSVKF